MARILINDILLEINIHAMQYDDEYKIASSLIRFCMIFLFKRENLIILYRLSHEDPQSHHSNLKQDQNYDDNNVLKHTERIIYKKKIIIKTRMGVPVVD